MMIRKRKQRERVIVVLEGFKASTDEKGIAPLLWALQDVVEPEDDLLVLTILNPRASVASSTDAGFCCMGNHHLCRGNHFIKFLDHQISQRREAYLRILRPFYDRCKSSGVKFQVKVAAGCRPKPIVIEEANNAKPTWIIMDTCFARDPSLRLSGNDCNIAFVNDDEEAEVYNRSRLSDGLETFIVTEENPNPKSPKLLKESVSQEEPHIRDSMPIFDGEFRPFPPSLLVNMSGECEYYPITVEPPSTIECENPLTDEQQPIEESEIQEEPATNGTGLYENVSLGRFSEAMVVLRLPSNLSWSEIVEITGRFRQVGCISQHEEFEIYDGFLDDPYSHVMVKRLKGDSNGVVEAEMRVTSSLFHRNILGLTGYHESANATALVYPHACKGTLDQYLYGLMGKPVGLTFQNRMKIAIEIGQGIRYMHEECPRGPVVHGDLQPCNIFLSCGFQPLISGFGRATWLQLEQVVPNYSYNRWWHKGLSPESMELIKSDIFSFGILLLRLFCQRSLPKDDRHLIELARPLLLQGAYHELLDQDIEDFDIHEIYRVMSAATQCTKAKPLSRPSMTQVVSILRGENFCATGSSPLFDGSVRRGTMGSSPSFDGSVPRGTKDFFY